MNDTSEEKALPPTTKKLLDARKKGQVAQSYDLVSAVGMMAAMAYLWSRSGTIANEWRETLIQSTKLQNESFDVAIRQIISTLASQCSHTLLPFLIIIVVASMLASMAVNKGIVFSLAPLTPKLEHLNPFAGLKRIFGLKNWVELAKTLVKALLLGSALFFVILGTLNTLVRLPVCGDTCIGYVFGGMAKLLLAIAVSFFLAAGVIDVMLQRWLFLRDMRMTHTEMKRERQDFEGNPLVRGAHRRLREEAAREPRLGVARATIIVRGRDIAVGLRFVRGETGTPIVVCRGKGDAANAIVATATVRLTPIVDDTELADGLRRTRVGAGIPSRHFERAARALLSAGTVS